jgi:hypothetical protein
MAVDTSVSANIFWRFLGAARAPDGDVLIAELQNAYGIG